MENGKQYPLMRVRSCTTCRYRDKDFGSICDRFNRACGCAWVCECYEDRDKRVTDCCGETKPTSNATPAPEQKKPVEIPTEITKSVVQKDEFAPTGAVPAPVVVVGKQPSNNNGGKP